jgi:hypothetical protein
MFKGNLRCNGTAGRFLPAAIPTLLIVCAGIAPAASAEGASPIESTGYVSLGTFLNKSSLKIRLDGEAGDIGTEINWGDTFGNNEQTRLRLDGLWRMTDRHHLRFMYTDYSRSKTATFEDDVNWGGELIPVNASVTGKVGFTIAELAYEYAVKRNENMELALSAGVHYTSFEAKLTAIVEGGGGSAGGTVGGKASVGAPLPVFGGHGLWHLGKDFYADAQVQWFALSMDGYDGSILNYRAAILWQPRKWGGIGIGYDSFNVDLKVDKDKFTGKMDWTYQGPQLFFNFTF